MGLVAYVLLVMFVATLIRSAFGFGEALISVPLLALSLPVKTAAPLAVLVSVTIAVIILAQDWRQVHFRITGWLLLATVAGIPLGLLLLTAPNQQAVKFSLAALIIAFSAYALLVRTPPQLHSDSRLWLLVCGFIAGIFGGGYGMNGPPLVIYGSMRRWSPQHFRATLQAYFLPASALGMAGYWIAGLWTSTVSRDYLFSLPVIVPAIILGRAINRRFRGEAFLKYVYAGLLVTGTVLLAQSLKH